MFNWNVFPFTKMNAINLDWLMKKFQELVDKTDHVDQAVLDAQAAAEAAEEAAQTITGAVLYDRVQTLTVPEQAQARDNIGAADAADVVPDVVQYNTVQTLTTSQKEQARDNIDAADAADTVGVLRYTVQTLTEPQKAQARDNIGAADADDLDDVLRTSAQTFTAAEKAQARDNIGAADAADLVDVLRYSEQTLTEAQKTQARDNIGAADTSIATSVLYTEQTLTDAQKEQARTNIGAMNSTPNLVVRPLAKTNTAVAADGASQFYFPISEFGSTGQMVGLSGYACDGTVSAKYLVAYRAYWQKSNDRIWIGLHNTYNGSQDVTVTAYAIFLE